MAALLICILEHELSRLLFLAGLPEPQAVEPVAGTMLGRREVAWRNFVRQLSGGGPAKPDMDFGSNSRRRWPGLWDVGI